MPFCKGPEPNSKSWIFGALVGLWFVYCLVVSPYIIQPIVKAKPVQPYVLPYTQTYKSKLPVYPTDTVAAIEAGRFAAQIIIQKHVIAHPKCSLRGHDQIIKNAVANFGDLKNQDWAWSFPKNNQVIFNTRKQWTAQYATLIWIHESLHLSQLCGPDNPKRNNRRTPCYLWEYGAVANSADITQAVREHLAVELQEFGQ